MKKILLFILLCTSCLIACKRITKKKVVNILSKQPQKPLQVLLCNSLAKAIGVKHSGMSSSPKSKI